MFLLEDVVFRKSVENYDALKKTEKDDIFETFKQKDYEKSKEDWRMLKEKLVLNNEIRKPDIRQIFFMYFELSEQNMTTNRFNWII